MKKFKNYFSVILLILVSLLFFSTVSTAEDTETITTVNLSHRIQREYKPEIANINVEVVNSDQDLDTAYSKTTTDMNEVVKILKTFKEVSFSTTTFNVNQSYIKNEDKKRELFYEVSTMIKIETDNLDELGKVIERVVAKGATDIRGISYGLKNPEEAKNEVIQKAIEEIFKKAEVIKESLNKDSFEFVKLNINDNYSIYDYNYGVMRSEAVGTGNSRPVPEITPQDVNVNVNISVEIEYK